MKIYSILLSFLLGPAALAANLPANIYTYSGVDPQAITDDSDLAPIDKIIGKSTTVALGEGVHTSGGFHELKFRLIPHLVEPKGFRVPTMETPRITALPATNFLKGCATPGKLDSTALGNALGSI